MKRSPAIAATGVTFAVGRLLLRTYFILGLLRLCPPSCFVRCVAICVCQRMLTWLAFTSDIPECDTLVAAQNKTREGTKRSRFTSHKSSKIIKNQRFNTSSKTLLVNGERGKPFSKNRPSRAVEVMGWLKEVCGTLKHKFVPCI